MHRIVRKSQSCCEIPFRTLGCALHWLLRRVHHCGAPTLQKNRKAHAGAFVQVASHVHNEKLIPGQPPKGSDVVPFLGSILGSPIPNPERNYLRAFW